MKSIRNKDYNTQKKEIINKFYNQKKSNRNNVYLD